MLVPLVVRQNSGDLYPSWEMVPRCTREQILELGHFLFPMLAEKEIVFRESDFRDHGLSQGAQNTGFLVSCDQQYFASQSQWQTTHLAVQEYLAALYVASSCPRPKDITWLVHRLGAGTGHLSTFWCLLATLLPPSSQEALLEGILVWPSSHVSICADLHADSLLQCSPN